MVYYAPNGQPPAFNYEETNSREKVTVWAALCGDGRIIGPYFFDANVNGRNYLEMINRFVVTEMILNYNFNIFGNVVFLQEIWWFQDGAPCHRARIVSDRLRQLFGNQIVALHHNPEWPPRSPDLTPCDFSCGDISKKGFTGSLQIICLNCVKR